MTEQLDGAWRWQVAELESGALVSHWRQGREQDYPGHRVSPVQ